MNCLQKLLIPILTAKQCKHTIFIKKGDLNNQVSFFAVTGLLDLFLQIYYS